MLRLMNVDRLSIPALWFVPPLAVACGGDDDFQEPDNLANCTTGSPISSENDSNDNADENVGNNGGDPDRGNDATNTGPRIAVPVRAAYPAGSIPPAMSLPGDRVSNLPAVTPESSRE